MIIIWPIVRYLAQCSLFDSVLIIWVTVLYLTQCALLNSVRLIWLIAPNVTKCSLFGSVRFIWLSAPYLIQCSLSDSVLLFLTKGSLYDSALMPRWLFVEGHDFCPLFPKLSVPLQLFVLPVYLILVLSTAVVIFLIISSILIYANHYVLWYIFLKTYNM